MVQSPAPDSQNASCLALKTPKNERIPNSYSFHGATLRERHHDRSFVDNEISAKKAESRFHSDFIPVFRHAVHEVDLVANVPALRANTLLASLTSIGSSKRFRYLPNRFSIRSDWTLHRVPMSDQPRSAFAGHSGVF